jgi:hypothetical protein
MEVDPQELLAVGVVRLTFVVAARWRIASSLPAAVAVEGSEGRSRRERMADSVVGQQEALASPRAPEDKAAVKSPEVPAERRRRPVTQEPLAR